MHCFLAMAWCDASYVNIEGAGRGWARLGNQFDQIRLALTRAPLDAFFCNSRPLNFNASECPLLFLFRTRLLLHIVCVRCRAQLSQSNSPELKLATYIHWLGHHSFQFTMAPSVRGTSSRVSKRQVSVRSDAKATRSHKNPKSILAEALAPVVVSKKPVTHVSKRKRHDVDDESEPDMANTRTTIITAKKVRYIST